jgi:hypothetical protein
VIPTLATEQEGVAVANSEVCYDLCCNYKHDFYDMKHGLELEYCEGADCCAQGTPRIFSFEEFIAVRDESDFVFQAGDVIFFPAEYEEYWLVMPIISLESILDSSEMGYFKVNSQSYGIVYVDNLETLEAVMKNMMLGDTILVPAVAEPVVFYCIDEFIAFFDLVPIVPLSHCDRPTCPGGSVWTSTLLLWYESVFVRTLTCSHNTSRDCTWAAVEVRCSVHHYWVRLHCSSCGIFGGWDQSRAGCGRRFLTHESGRCFRIIHMR